MRPLVVSGRSTKMRSSHSAKAFAEVDRPAYTRSVHDPDPARELAERPRVGRNERPRTVESPTGRSATHKETNLAHAHTPSAKFDSPPRSPQSMKLEAERQARLLPGGKPSSEEPPERATQRSETNLAFVKDDVPPGATVVLEVRPRERFSPERLSVHREPENVGAVEASLWQIFGLTVADHQCLGEKYFEAGVPADRIPEDAFTFVPAPPGAKILLVARNDSGRPACLQAVLFGSAGEESDLGPRLLPAHEL